VFERYARAVNASAAATNRRDSAWPVLQALLAFGRPVASWELTRTTDLGTQMLNQHLRTLTDRGLACRIAGGRFYASLDGYRIIADDLIRRRRRLS
jgi:hypothetical protein